MTVFDRGSFVDISGISKGKGFAGGMKRHGFHGGPKTHGQSDRWRAPGSVGAGSTPGRVFKGKRMAGHYGNETITTRGLEVVSVDLENNIISIKGAVPGARDTLVMVAGEGNIPVYVDPKKDNFFAYNKIRLFKPNLFEFESAINFKEQDKSFEDLGKDLRKKINAEILMVTRSEEGVTLFTDKNVQTISTKARKVHDVSGAGDTAISAFVLADLCGANIEESAMISNYAAGRVCEEVGVVPISLEMIKDIVDHYSN